MSTASNDTDHEFEPWAHSSPFVDAIGSLLSHRSDPLRARFIVNTAKLNGRGRLHAGAITTIADIVIGHGLSAITEPTQRYVTIQLSCQFLGSAELDDVIDVTVTPSKTHGRVAAGRATFQRHDGRTIATADALFLAAT